MKRQNRLSHPSGQHIRRRLPVPKLLELLDAYETGVAAVSGVLPHPVSSLRAHLARLVD